MKKYFSLIAVAMIAVSSVFTSCSKDGAGSTFDPDLGQNTASANASNTSTPSLTSTPSNAVSSTSITGTWVRTYDTKLTGYTAKDSTVYTFTSDGQWTRRSTLDQSGEGVIKGLEHREQCQSGTYSFDASKNLLTLVQKNDIMNLGSTATEATLTYTVSVNGNQLKMNGYTFTKQN